MLIAEGTFGAKESCRETARANFWVEQLLDSARTVSQESQDPKPGDGILFWIMQKRG